MCFSFYTEIKVISINYLYVLSPIMSRLFTSPVQTDRYTALTVEDSLWRYGVPSVRHETYTFY